MQRHAAQSFGLIAGPRRQQCSIGFQMMMMMMMMIMIMMMMMMTMIFFTRRERVRDAVLLFWSSGGYSSIAKLRQEYPTSKLSFSSEKHFASIMI